MSLHRFGVDTGRFGVDVKIWGIIEGAYKLLEIASQLYHTTYMWPSTNKLRLVMGELGVMPRQLRALRAVYMKDPEEFHVFV